MSENINENEQIRESTSAEAAVISEVQEAMKHLRICPSKVLESLSHLRIDSARIKPIHSQALRIGGNADVEAAILASDLPPSSSEPDVTEYVAVKKLRFDTETDDDRVLAPFAHEVSLLNGLSHDNVVKVIGFVENVDKGVAWMVFSWEKNGNLREFVRSANWELPERVSLIYDVTSGMSYLHGRDPPICHGDLKSLNILVNPENRAVITDFGSARPIDSATEAQVSGVNEAKPTKIQPQNLTETTIETLKAGVAASGKFITMTGPAWTIRWAAPELLDGVLPGLGSDVWAFGWICWEVVTGNFPFHEENDVTVTQRIMTGDLPNISNNAQLSQIKTLCSLMEECLRATANERPLAIRCKQVVSFMDQSTPLRRGRDRLDTARSSALLLALGRIELGNGVMEKAQKYFQQSLEVAESVGDERGKARAMSAVGEAYRLQSVYSEAEKWYMQSRDLYANIGDQHGFAESVHRLGEVYRMQNEYSKVEESYIQSRDLYSKIRNQLGFAHSVLTLGDVYRMRNEYSKAESSYVQSRDLYSTIGYQLGFAHSVKALGDVYRMRQEYSKAEMSYIESRDLYSKIGDRLGFAKSVKALGDVYQMRNRYRKAEELYIQSRDLYSKIEHHLGVAQSVQALGDVYRMQKKYYKSEGSYIESRDIYFKIGDQHGLAHSLQGLGRIHSARKGYESAAESYSQAQHIYHRIGDKYSSANIFWDLGWLHCNQAQYDEARLHIQKASITYGELGLTQYVADCTKFLAEIPSSVTHFGPSLPSVSSLQAEHGFSRGSRGGMGFRGGGGRGGTSRPSRVSEYVAGCEDPARGRKGAKGESLSMVSMITVPRLDVATSARVGSGK